MNEIVREGGCLCGRIRYRTEGEPESVVLCHCTMCRRAGGAPVVAWATFLKTQVTWLAEAPARYVSSDSAELGYCPHCGSALTFMFTSRKREWIDLTVGTFDQPESLPPSRHVFDSTRISWVDLAAHLPRFPGNSPS